MVSYVILLSLLAAASSFHPLPEMRVQARPGSDKNDVAAKSDTRLARDEARAGLPHAFGRTFRNLDAYLLHLQQVAAPVDLPWWRKVGPNRFERMTGKRVPHNERRFATRAELARQYGFAR